MREVFIIGGGPSLSNFDFKRLHKRDVIATNKAAFFVPYANYFISMDYSFIDKVGLEKVKALGAAKFFVINFAVPYIKVIRGAITDIRNNFIYSNLYTCMDSVIICRRENGIGTSFHDFRCGNNSGYCALQLALVLNYDVIYLLGMDFKLQNNKTHFHAGYRQPIKTFEVNLEKYRRAFIGGIIEGKSKFPETKIYSCSSTSLLNEIVPYKSIDEVLL